MKWITSIAVLAVVAAGAAFVLAERRSGKSLSSRQAESRSRNPGPAVGADSPVSVVGLELFAPDPDGHATVFPCAAGTVVHLRLNRPDLHIFSANVRASRLDAMTDDRGTTPLATPSHDGQTCFRTVSEPGSDAHTLAFQVFGGRVPETGASRIRIQGQLAVVHGVGETTTEAPLKLARYASARCEPGVTFRVINIIEAAGPGRCTVIKLQIDPTPAIVKRVQFLDASGQEITSKPLTRRLDGDFAWQDFALDRRPESVTLRVTAFEKIQTTMVPLDVTAGVGF